MAFVELNTGLYGIIGLILFFIYFGDKFSKKKGDVNSNMSSICCWCLCCLCVLSVISTGSATMDAGMLSPQTVGGTYLLCCITLISSSLLVTYS